jgi:ketosteroid isomerase-like protein
LFAVDDRVVVAYTLGLHRRDGAGERMAVMAIWTLDGGKVTALREVDAPAA